MKQSFLVKQSCLLLVTALLASSFSLGIVNAFATEQPASTLETKVEVESPFAEKDYSETVLSEYTDVLMLTNATVSADDRIRIEKVISIIEKDENGSADIFLNENVYLKSLLIQIDNLEQLTANDFFVAYSQYLDANKVSDSDNDKIKLTVLAEMLEVYYSYNESIQSKIHEMCPERLDRCITLFNAFCTEKNDFIAKHEAILKKTSDEVSLEDFDEIISAVSDFSALSKAAQSLLINEKKVLDNSMTAYLTLKEIEDEKNANEDARSVSSTLESVSGQKVSASDVVDEPKSGGIISENDIGYDVYDTGDASFGSIMLANDTLWISFFVAVLMYFFIHEYIGMDVCYATVMQFSGSVNSKCSYLGNQVKSLRNIDIDEWLESSFENVHGKITRYIRSKERVNKIRIAE